MALYQVDLISVANDDVSNPFVNTFFYNADDLLPSSVVAVALADAFFDLVVDGAAGWKSVVQVGMDADLIRVTSSYSPTVLGLKSIAVAGLRTGGQMPRFVSWGFKSERTVANIRAGFKRVGLISESDTAGSVPAAGVLAVLEAFAASMSEALVFSDGIGTVRALPVIVKRIPVVIEGETVGYRLPTSDFELQYSIAENWVFQSITSQNSRKS